MDAKVKATDRLLKAVLFFVVGVTCAYASDVTAIYARVDKVVLEPNGNSPETVQIWGVFSIARPNWNARSYTPGDDYQPAARGYLYFKLNGNPATARREWADLKQVAGTGQIVSFGGRFQLQARLRGPDERPKDPDPYAVNVGVTRVRGNTDYPPIRRLLDFKD